MRCSPDAYADYLISSTGQATATGPLRLYNGAISRDQVTRLLTNSRPDCQLGFGTKRPRQALAEKAAAVARVFLSCWNQSNGLESPG